MEFVLGSGGADADVATIGIYQKITVSGAGFDGLQP